MSPMSDCKHIGKTSYEETQFEWKLIDYFFNNVSKSNDLDSSIFDIGSNHWRLKLRRSNTSDTEFLLLEKLTINYEIEVEYEIGLKKLDGSVQQFFTGKFHNLAERSDLPVGQHSKSELLKRKHELAPPNGLTIICILRRGTAQQILLPQAPPTKFINLDMLSENFKSLSENKDSCDVILKVKEKEFPAHKAILVARSPVFAAMFKHDTSEKRTGIINIPDCDPDSFHEFLDYLYCGKLEDISFSSACYLYKTSDKYNVLELMPFCVERMKHCLTEDNVCDVVILAELYDDTKLMTAAQAFFNQNANKVVLTSAWESLMETNYRLANKLIIKMTSTTKISCPNEESLF